MKKTAEFVSPKHPDKVCDFIADSILDAYLAGDVGSRVAIEVMGGHGLVTINGEATSGAEPDIRDFLKLDSVKFADTCTWGHFGRGFSWG